MAFVALIVLLAVASIDRWARGKSWTEPGPPVPGLTIAGVGLGLVALGAALLFAGPALERATERSIDWTQIAAVRGNLGVLVTAIAVLGAQAIASELVFRRWLLDRIDGRLHGLGGKPWLAAIAAAVAEGVVSGGHLGSGLGAAAAGFGFGLLYLGAGRRLAPAIACRLAFEIGALLVVYARLV